MDAPPTNLQSAADLKETSLATWRRGRRAARADERVGSVARLRYLFEPAAGGQGVAETIGGNTASSSPTALTRLASGRRF